MDEPTKPARSRIRLSAEEAWAMLERSLVGVLTTLRSDGRPVALPIWYVVLDRRIYMTTRGRKVTRVRADPRASFLVEEGERWAELRAVHADCRAAIINPSDDLADRIRAAMDEKYRTFRTGTKDMPTATRDHYRRSMGAVIEVVPEGKLLTRDNRRLGVS